jgi:hypothetical protein
MKSRFRIRRNGEVRVDDKFVAGRITDDNRFVRANSPGAVQFWASPAADDLTEWLSQKLATPPSVTWPPVVPMTPLPAVTVAIAPAETEDMPDGWYYWRKIRQHSEFSRRDAGLKVFRSLASDRLPLPDGWRLTGMDDHITDADRVAFANWVFQQMADPDRSGQIDTSDAALRQLRGDPCHQRDDILGAPVWMSCDQAAGPGLMMLNSPHYHLVVREYADNGLSRWTASTGTGNFMSVVPGPPSYATQREAIATGVLWWRQGVVERIAEIAAARGGTCAWGVTVKPLDHPILTVIAAEETAREIRS